MSRAVCGGSSKLKNHKNHNVLTHSRTVQKGGSNPLNPPGKSHPAGPASYRSLPGSVRSLPDSVRSLPGQLNVPERLFSTIKHVDFAGLFLEQSNSNFHFLLFGTVGLRKNYRHLNIANRQKDKQKQYNYITLITYPVLSSA